MSVRLKPLGEQTIVITGASSGIGRVTARMAARRGAAVVLAARDRRALRDAVNAIERAGGRATYVVADVTRRRDLEHLADVAVEEFGGVDTWVNNAGVGLYGRLEEITDDDHRRLFDVNYWGVVNGSRAALGVLREHGGALINVGSALSDRALPLQGAYAATKHAVKAFTSALRMELEAEGVPVSVSLVKPAAISTPFYQHARNYMSRDPKMVPPVYAPEVAARAILSCAVRARRDVAAGGAAKAMAAAEEWAPEMTDRMMARTLVGGQQLDRPAQHARGILHRAPRGDGGERNPDEGFVRDHSAVTDGSARPVRTAALGLGVAMAIAAGVQWLRGRQSGTVDVPTPSARRGTREAARGATPRSTERLLARSAEGDLPDSAEAMLYTPGGEGR